MSLLEFATQVIGATDNGWSFFIGLWLLHNVVLVLAIQQSEPSICRHTTLPSRTSLPHPSARPFRSPHHRAPSWAPCALYNSFPWRIYFTHGGVYMSVPTSQFAPLPLSLLLSTCPFSTCFFSCSANWFIHTTFLDSNICVKKRYFFFSLWLTLLCMTDSRCIHIFTDDQISPFLWLSNISLYICTTFLSIHLSMDI